MSNSKGTNDDLHTKHHNRSCNAIPNTIEG